MIITNHYSDWVFNIAGAGGKWRYTLQLLRDAWQRGETTELHTGNISPPIFHGSNDTPPLPYRPLPSLFPARVEEHLHARTHLHDLIYVILPVWPNRVDFISLHNGRCFTLKKIADLYQLSEQLQHPRVEYWTPKDEIPLWIGDNRYVARALILMNVLKGKRL